MQRSPVRHAVVGVTAAMLLVTLAAPVAVADRPHVYAITDATVIVSPGNALEGATVVVRAGLIEAVGADVVVPPDAVELDGAGLTVHAGFIDPYAELALPRRQGQGGPGGPGGFFQALIQRIQRGDRPKPGTGHPLELVHPDHSITDELVRGDGRVERFREQGFTAALVAPRDGIFRGTSAVVALRDGHPRDLVVHAPVAQHVAYETGGFLGGYPSSLMGAIVTIRQVLLDARRHSLWMERYRAHPQGMRRPDHVSAFPALQPVIEGSMPLFFEVGSTGGFERTLELADEFDVGVVLVGNGREYEVVDLLQRQEAPVLVPLDFPDEPEVEDDDEALEVSLAELRHWDRAPGNAAALSEAGVTFAFTARGLDNPRDYVANVRKAIEAGLAEDAALAAATTVPAHILGLDAVLGTVEAGKIANLVVATGAPFAEDTEIRHVFVDGIDHELEAEEPPGDPDAVVDPRGTWEVTTHMGPNTRTSTWVIRGEPGDWSGTAKTPEGDFDFESVRLEGNALTVVPQGPPPMEVTVVIEGDEFEGTAELPNGMSLKVSGERISGPEVSTSEVAETAGGAR